MNAGQITTAIGCGPERAERLAARSRVDPILAAWLHTWEMLDRRPGLADAFVLVEYYAAALDQARAALLRAEQVRPVELRVECAASACELRRALDGRRAEGS
jgi:hypothetical protein